MFNKTRRRLWIAGKYTNAALMLALCTTWMYEHTQNTHVDMMVYQVDKDTRKFHRAIDADLKKHMRSE